MLRARGIGNYGDYYTPEGFVPGSRENTAMPWFVIYPLGRSFSYEPDPARHKGGGWIIRNLVDAVAKGGAFMVGIGPDGSGRFHPTAIENLKEAGAWLRVNGEAIYATRPREGDLWHEGDNIRYTRSKDGRFVYAIALEWPGRRLTLEGVRPAAGSAVSMLGLTQPLAWTRPATGCRSGCRRRSRTRPVGPARRPGSSGSRRPDEPAGTLAPAVGDDRVRVRRHHPELRAAALVHLPLRPSRPAGALR